MVLLNEVGGKMFWGVTLDAGKRYSQVVEHAFHISMAALEVHQKHGEMEGKIVSVMAQSDGAEFLLCTLSHGKLMNQPVDLNFNDGEEITFFLNGTGCVHLTGYLVLDDLGENEGDDSQLMDELSSEEDMSDEEEDESDDDAPELEAIEDWTSSDEDEESEENLTPQSGQKKRKMTPQSEKSKKQKLTIQEVDSDDDDDEEDDDFDLSNVMDDSDDDDEMDSDEEDSDMDGSFLAKQAVTVKPKKSPKVQKNEKLPATPPASKPQPEKSPENQNGTSEKKKKKKKNKKNKNKGEETPGGGKDESQNATPKSQQKKAGEKAATPKSQKKAGENTTTPKSQQKKGGETPKGKATPGKKSVLEGGVTSEDLKEGHGPTAKAGKMVHVYYTGKLVQGGKVFDKKVDGKPFNFKLGLNEVIRGWDVGVSGMKVGGKRRLIIPAKMAYAKRALPGIPSNSSLQFEVELKAVG